MTAVKSIRASPNTKTDQLHADPIPWTVVSEQRRALSAIYRALSAIYDDLGFDGLGLMA